MDKEFAPYEQALALKELGFDEPCVAIFGRNNELSVDDGFYKQENYHKDTVLAPTFSQCFRWFRKKHGLHVIIDEEIRPQIKDSNSKLLFEYTKDGKYAGFEYEEAELECLNKLIELCKNN